ncbi:Cysteine desulfurase [Ignavibacterium album JCM 16511]|uniref:cysteine desulfurase n=1 Tax=Ignavibacterium album (strain DSM 19864 / JCM 16511 / NBRC 101810 / Mat9-16) TaxID=945713 RepID=I0AK35_IGNAJ|nr:cysteine desulfurase family protein [Ignavibacterium album]AFH49342.1 Cysteine desulfurase [Ignavibacterium album JCM 16511]
MKVKLPIYLDNNATTPVDSRVLESMLPYFSEKFGNPLSKHTFGYVTNAAVDFAREQIANLIKAEKNEIYFTSGASESINIIHFGIALKHVSKGNHIISSDVEHSASYESLLQLIKKGFDVTFLKCDSKGFIHPEQIIEAIRTETILVSIIAANNEIGTVNNISEIGKVCRANNILFHTDATQAVGKIKIDVQEMNIDFLSFSSHKIYGPKGIGGLFIRKGLEQKISPLIFGGGQEKGIRPGTLNVPAIVGFGKAAEICNKDFEKDFIHTKNLRDKLYKNILSSLDSVTLNGDKDNRLPGNLNLLIKGIKADNLISNLREIAFSSGATCSSETGKPSRVLKAIGLSEEDSRCCIRIGVGRFNTSEEIEYASEKIIEEITKLRLKRNYQSTI